MDSMSFIIGLKEVHRHYNREMQRALDKPMPAYYRFLKELGFTKFIEEVVTACSMFSRCVATSRDTLEDLAHSLGANQYRLSYLDRENVSNLVLMAGREVIGQLEAHRYYLSDTERPRGSDRDPHYATDAYTMTSVDRIGEHSFIVKLEVIDRLVQDELSFHTLSQTKTHQWSH